MYEIYNEQIRDLLRKRSPNDKPLKHDVITQSDSGRVVITDLTMLPVGAMRRLCIRRCKRVTYL